MLAPLIAQTAQGASKRPNNDFSNSYSYQFPLKDLFPANISGDVAPALDCINDALEKHGFITDKGLIQYNDLDTEALRVQNASLSLPQHYARIGIVDRTVSDLQDIGYQEAHIIFTDPEAVRRKFPDIVKTACEIARERDLGRDDRPKS